LESALATWLETEDALLFASGYAANVGLVSALAQPGDLVVSDALNHASLIDGCRLSRAEVVVVPHRDLGAIRQTLEATRLRTVWVVSEAYFSMDGTTCDVAALGELLRRFPNAHLLLDEAHSLGIFGPSGRGLAAGVGYRPAAVVGTFGKAFGLQGAFIAGSTALCAWLWNRARSFVYSTATSPSLAAGIAERLERVVAADVERRELESLCTSFHVQLEERFPGRRPVGARGPIAPVLLGNDALAVETARRLGEQGILTQAIRPPTVAPGTARLRMSLGSHLDARDLDSVLGALGELIPSRTPT
jgi:8-amino-7-oxononanoate synthase